MNVKTKKSIFWAIGAGVSLLSLYFLILALANSFSHAFEQFSQLWYWILALVAGFSIQVGLYSYIHQEIQQKKMKAMANKELVASTGVSTGSMVACCAHHLVDVLPILGLSAVFLFLAEYQALFLLFGIASNIIGIIFMLEVIKKHALYKTGGFLSRTSRFNLRVLRNWAIVGSSFAFLTMFFLIRSDQGKNSLIDSNLSADNSRELYESNEVTKYNSEVLSETDITSLPSRVNNEGGLSVEIKPLNFSFNEPIRFEVSFNTHQGSLDFDLTKKSLLVDNQNNQYLPLEWQGDRGGHHLSGQLVFPSISPETKRMKLKIFDIYGVEEREFEWSLKGRG